MVVHPPSQLLSLHTHTTPPETSGFYCKDADNSYKLTRDLIHSDICTKSFAVNSPVAGGSGCGVLRVWGPAGVGVKAAVGFYHHPF